MQCKTNNYDDKFNYSAFSLYAYIDCMPLFKECVSPMYAIYTNDCVGDIYGSRPLHSKSTHEEISHHQL